MDQNLSHQKKWQAKICTKLERAEAAQIWPFFRDFFGLHKWFSGLPDCRGIHGVNGEPGCIRYCSGFGIRRAVANGDNNNSKNESSSSLISWSKERLVAIDHDQMEFTYEIVDCNIGFKSYVSTIRIVSGGGGGGGGGAAVEWWISLEPVEGCKLEDLVVKYEVGLRLMVKKMEDAIFGSS